MNLGRKPSKATHWSRRVTAVASGMTRTAIPRIWQACGLLPDRSGTLKLPKDPHVIDQARDITGLYLDPLNGSRVPCADVKSQNRALGRTQRVLPISLGVSERRKRDYSRYGTTTLLTAQDASSGGEIGDSHRRQCALKFRQCLERINAERPADLDSHLIWNNASTLKTTAFPARYARRPRFHNHFTPAGASRIRQVEDFFGLLTQRQPHRGTHRSTVALERASRTYVETNSQDPRPHVLVKSADERLESKPPMLSQHFRVRPLSGC